VCRVSVTSVEECLPGLRWEEKSGIVLATHTAPTIPAGEKSRPPRVFQRHPRITLSGFWAKIGGVLRDTASTASGRKRKAVRFVGKSGLTPNCRRQQVIPPPEAA